MKVLSPEQIKATLDYHVIGQDQAKDVLSVLGFMYQMKNTYSIEGHPLSCFIIGPTGCGKTHMIQMLASCLGHDYIHIDANQITPDGYKGSDLQDHFRDFKSGSKVVVHVDEFDKISNKNKYEDWNVSRQSMFLKMLEGEITIHKDKTHSHVEKKDLSNALFIFSGAFQSIRDEMKEKRSIGFKADIIKKGEEECLDLYEKVVSYGIIKEIVGRITSICCIDELGAKELRVILDRFIFPEVKKYFDYCRTKIELTRDDYEVIIQGCIKKKIGARGLRIMLLKHIQDKLVNLKPMGYIQNKSEINYQLNYKIEKPEQGGA